MGVVTGGLVHGEITRVSSILEIAGVPVIVLLHS
jgi:hypothetical protein